VDTPEYLKAAAIPLPPVIPEFDAAFAQTADEGKPPA
jgi:hypothetical protein